MVSNTPSFDVLAGAKHLDSALGVVPVLPYAKVFAIKADGYSSVIKIYDGRPSTHFESPLQVRWPISLLLRQSFAPQQQ